MNVSLNLKDWEIKKETKETVPNIVGTYELSMNGKSIAKQSFNGNYDTDKLPFSNDLIQKVMALEKEIIAEIEGFIK